MSVAVADVLRDLSDLPPFPKVTARLLSLLNDTNVSTNELSSVISTDPALVMKVIHLSNSPFYMTSQPIGTVKQAVMVLGINTIKTITTAASVQKGFASFQPRRDVFDLTAFWTHCYATAIAAGRLVDITMAEARDRLYLAGLIHDIGKLIIAYHWPESWKRMVAQVKAYGQDYHEVESQLFACPHNEIAATLCRNWQFPDNIIALVAAHHGAGEANGISTGEQELIMKADALATARGFGFPELKNQSDDIEATSENANFESFEEEVKYQLGSFDL